MNEAVDALIQYQGELMLPSEAIQREIEARQRIREKSNWKVLFDSSKQENER